MTPINMRRLAQLFWLFVAVIFPVSALAQGPMIAGDVDAYVALLSADCPIGHGDAWALNAIEAEGDTICAVLQTPSSLAGFLSMLTGEGDNVKRMWLTFSFSASASCVMPPLSWRRY